MSLDEIKQKYAKKRTSLVSAKILKEIISELKESDPSKISLAVLQVLDFRLNQFSQSNPHDVTLLQAYKDLILEVVEKKAITDEQLWARNEAQVVALCDETSVEKRKCQALMGHFLKWYRERYGRSYKYKAIRTFYSTNRDMANMSSIEKTLGARGTEYLNWCFQVKEPGWVGGFYDTNILASSSMMNEFEHMTTIVRKDISKAKEQLDSDFLQFIRNLSEKRFNHIQSVKDIEWLLTIEQTPDIFEEPFVIQILKEARKRGIIAKLSTPPEKWSEERKQAFLRGEYER